MDFFGVVAMNLGILVGLALVGCAAAWLLARLMDAANDRTDVWTTWGSALEEIQSTPLSAAIYYAARWVGICLLIGILFSRTV